MLNRRRLFTAINELPHTPYFDEQVTLLSNLGKVARVVGRWPLDSSFPSGHTSTSFACATILTLAFPRAAPGFFLLALAIGFSRIYVGAHYPLDVVGGAALGIVTALLLRAAIRWRSTPAPRAG